MGNSTSQVENTHDELELGNTRSSPTTPYHGKNLPGKPPEVLVLPSSPSRLPTTTPKHLHFTPNNKSSDPRRASSSESVSSGSPPPSPNHTGLAALGSNSFVDDPPSLGYTQSAANLRRDFLFLHARTVPEQAKFWKELCSQFVLSKYALKDEEVVLSNLINEYDMSKQTLDRIFQSAADENAIGLTREEFKAALKKIRIEFVGRSPDEKESHFRDFFHAIDQDNSGTITPEEFRAMKNIKLAMLSLRESDQPNSHIRILDMVPHPERLQTLDTKDSEEEFLFGHRNTKCCMRWVLLQDSCKSNILKVAVKYSIHPIATEDFLTLRSQKATIKAYHPHHFVVLPCFSLSRELLQTTNNFRGNRSAENLDVQATGLYRDLQENILVCNAALLVSGAPKFETIITTNSEWVHFCRCDCVGDRCKVPLSDESNTSVSIFDKLIKRATSGHDIARQDQNMSDWWLYEIIDFVVDSYNPVVDAYQVLVDIIYTQLTTNEERVDRGAIKALLFMRQDLVCLRASLRPIQAVIHRIIVHPDFAQVTHFLRDVEDNVVIALEQIHGMLETCQLMQEQYSNFRESRSTDNLFLLTTVTFVFIPSQFLTGMFGMNFAGPNGSTIPLMKDKNGFVYFWVLVVLATLIALTALGWLKCRKTGRRADQRTLRESRARPLMQRGMTLEEALKMD
eukprot:c20402_g1_i1.p1 GENE.c20402_g1_i1~~c20402_g1_i1.p1  ORF type:complete len:680 (+),score=176.76 c20402_g1_i1:167-2206(+)